MMGIYEAWVDSLVHGMNVRQDAERDTGYDFAPLRGLFAEVEK